MGIKFDLQLFAEEVPQVPKVAEPIELSVEEAVAKIKDIAKPAEPAKEEPATEEPVKESEPEKEEEPEPPAELDLSAKVKFKANGQEQEKTIQELISDSQLASNYNQRMRELADQRKALETQPVKPEPVDLAKAYEELDRKVTDRAMKMLGISADDFFPDSSINRVHFAVYQQALADINRETMEADYTARQEQAIEDNYIATIQAVAADPNFQQINQSAEKAMFDLPQSGAAGIKQFNELYPVYLKLQQRDSLAAAGKDPRQVKLSAKEVDTITKFYMAQKEAYSVKDKPKVEVPKGVQIKPTVKVETSGGDKEPLPKFKPKKVYSVEEAARLMSKK